MWSPKSDQEGKAMAIDVARDSAVATVTMNRPEALNAFTGTRQMDGSAMLAYFKPLKDWLDQQNQGRQCGWQ